MPKEQTYWCVYDRNGRPLLSTMGYSRKYAISEALFEDYTWQDFKKAGYTVQKVTINIVTK